MLVSTNGTNNFDEEIHSSPVLNSSVVVHSNTTGMFNKDDVDSDQDLDVHDIENSSQKTRQLQPGAISEADLLREHHIVQTLEETMPRCILV